MIQNKTRFLFTSTLCFALGLSIGSDAAHALTQVSLAGTAANDRVEQLKSVYHFKGASIVLADYQHPLLPNRAQMIQNTPEFLGIALRAYRDAHPTGDLTQLEFLVYQPSAERPISEFYMRLGATPAQDVGLCAIGIDYPSYTVAQAIQSCVFNYGLSHAAGTTITYDVSLNARQRTAVITNLQRILLDNPNAFAGLRAYQGRTLIELLPGATENGFGFEENERNPSAKKTIILSLGTNATAPVAESLTRLALSFGSEIQNGRLNSYACGARTAQADCARVLSLLPAAFERLRGLGIYAEVQNLGVSITVTNRNFRSKNLNTPDGAPYFKLELSSRLTSAEEIAQKLFQIYQMREGDPDRYDERQAITIP